MGVKALQKQLSATVFMKAGISGPALIRFNTVLPVCLSAEMRFQGGFEDLRYPDHSAKSRESW